MSCSFRIRGNGEITLTDSAVGGQLVQEQNGRIITNNVVGLGRGFTLGAASVASMPASAPP